MLPPVDIRRIWGFAERGQTSGKGGLLWGTTAEGKQFTVYYIKVVLLLLTFSLMKL